MNSYAHKLSVIIPYKDTKPYIKECLDSVLKATAAIDSEIILVNDFSTDGSEGIVLSYADKYPNIKPIKCETDTRGPGAARNVGIEYASGEFIAFVDSDDVVLPDIYTDGIMLMDCHNSDICVCDVSRYNNNKQTYSPAQNRALSNTDDVLTSLQKSPDLIYGAFCWNTMHRSSFLKKNNILFPEDVYYEDFVFCFKALVHAKRITINRAISYLWRIRDEGVPSITQSYHENDNFKDRYRMNCRVLEYSQESSCSKKKREALLRKVAQLFPTAAFAPIESLSDDVLLGRVRDMKNLSDQYFDENVFNSIPIIWEQIWRDIINEDIVSLRKDCKYRLEHYYKSPVKTNRNSTVLELNDDIIRIKRRKANADFTQSIPVCFIRSFSQKNSILALNGVLYFPRVSVPYDKNRSLKAWLYNVITGEKTEVPRTEIKATELTEQKGNLINPADGTEYQCNYEGCGFQLKLNLDKLLKQLPSGKYMIMLEYYSPVKSGVRMLRGMDRDVISALNGFSYENESRVIKTDVDPRQTLQIRLMDRESEKELENKNTEIEKLEGQLKYVSEKYEASMRDAEASMAEIAAMNKKIDRLEATTEKLKLSLQTSKEKNAQIRSSWSFRVGRIIMWLPSKLRKMISN